MVRRVASQVHQQVSRLMRANYIQKEPAWFNAVLDNPPLNLPPKSPPPRTAYDVKPPKSKLKAHSTRPLPIYYLEDDIRRQFFKDHPFEAFRPTTLVESDKIENAHPVTGDKWTRLRQRGRNPTSDDAVKFCLNLYQHHGLSLSDAYTTSVAQYRALRSEHHISTTFAVQEAQFLGSTFGPSEIETSLNLQKKALQTWSRKEELDEGAIAARKRWKAIVEKSHGRGQWSKGEEYVRLWQEGVRPNYMPALTEPVKVDSAAIPSR
ncbi:mitochondrial ribosomal protein S25-domain-containing protein [Crepidotus variabilis]|uniref:Small ribosomal subunit protein mS23 n=1 Tax=Crepidotus variabilis TaxID=179855 RepID=A0A9P6EEV5_9AGAR|nr:mitochondrial ribosomal protein S25-domain-containing protein [Crepidotus variabilis]